MTHRFTLVALLALAGCAEAAEGLWQPRDLASIEESLRAAGIAVDPRELSHLDRYPMNAVVDFGGKCSAALVSPMGLLLTTRHCANQSLQFNTSVDRDLSAEGLVAPTLGEELPGSPGLRVLVTQSSQDVTAQLLTRLPAGMDDRARTQSIEQRSRRLVAACESSPGFRCQVRSFAAGSEYALIKQIEIRDVRLAYAPAAGVGEFGGAADTWKWPRHAGDFAMFRAYVGPDGKPADFSELNVPLRSPSHLKLQMGGIRSGEFAMAVGYPGHARDADANATLRVGYGNVIGERQVDGGVGPAFSDSAGLTARHHGTAPVDVGVRLLAALKSGRFGPYALGATLPVNFLADLDVAAGSSGSPLLNARAELVGLVFDGNRRAIASDRLFDPADARSIAVDIRYLLWVMDAVDGAHRLLEEMGVEPAFVDESP